ncbi:MAG: methyltransferase [Bacteroidetes bacterium]|nr:methyltransferase [Bacteroidota bacterium]
MAFQFRQFSIEDDQSSMKVGTDAVLLGAWASGKNPSNILEVGCGCGLISLMMAQRFPRANILAIDIHTPSIIQAKENFARSAWPERISAKEISLQEMAKKQTEKFDLIISNPPYFIDSLKPPDPDKHLAKHTSSLSYRELAEGVSLLLHKNGKFAIILPFANQVLFDAFASTATLIKTKQLNIIPVTGKKPNRVLSEWGLSSSDLLIENLRIREDAEMYAPEYKELTLEFYLAL